MKTGGVETRRPLAGRVVVVTRAAAQAGVPARCPRSRRRPRRPRSRHRHRAPGQLDAARCRPRARPGVPLGHLHQRQRRGHGAPPARRERPRRGRPPRAARRRHRARHRGGARRLGARAGPRARGVRGGGARPPARRAIARGDRVLLPRAAETRDLLVRELAALGAQVDEVAAYRTRPAEGTGAEVRALLARGEVDVVTFTSSSTARHFAALFAPGELAPLMQGVRGGLHRPGDARHRRALGLDTAIMPDEYTIPALAAAIASHFGNEKGADDAVPGLPSAATARIAPPAPHGARDRPEDGRLHPAPLHRSRAWDPRAHRVDAGAVPIFHRRAPEGVQGRGVDGDPRGAALRPPTGEGPPRQRGVRRRRHHPAGGARPQGHHPRPARHHRRVPLRVHEPRPLRRGGGRIASRTIPPSTSSRAPRSPTSRRARTWWPPRT